MLRCKKTAPQPNTQPKTHPYVSVAVPPQFRPHRGHLRIASDEREIYHSVPEARATYNQIVRYKIPTAESRVISQHGVKPRCNEIHRILLQAEGLQGAFHQDYKTASIHHAERGKKNRVFSPRETNEDRNLLHAPQSVELG